MRWKSKRKPELYEYRVRSGFLWFPVKLSNEWRWFEKATWSESYIATWPDIYMVLWVADDGTWRKMDWLDSQEEIDRIKNKNYN
jgi:hypothetical protein